MKIRSMLAGALAAAGTAVLAVPAGAQTFEASPRMFQPIAATEELHLAQAGPRFHDYDEDWRGDRDWRDWRDGRDWRDRRYRDCHRGADRHPGLRGLHRHSGRYCSVQFLRPVHNPRYDQYCVYVGGVRFCGG